MLRRAFVSKSGELGTGLAVLWAHLTEVSLLSGGIGGTTLFFSDFGIGVASLVVCWRCLAVRRLMERGHRGFEGIHGGSGPHERISQRLRLIGLLCKCLWSERTLAMERHLSVSTLDVTSSSPECCSAMAISLPPSWFRHGVVMCGLSSLPSGPTSKPHVSRLRLAFAGR